MKNVKKKYNSITLSINMMSIMYNPYHSYSYSDYENILTKTSISLSSSHFPSYTWELAEEMFRNEKGVIIIASMIHEMDIYNCVLSRKPFTREWVRTIVKAQVCESISKINEMVDGRAIFLIEQKNQFEMIKYDEHFRNLAYKMIDYLSM